MPPLNMRLDGKTLCQAHDRSISRTSSLVCRGVFGLEVGVDPADCVQVGCGPAEVNGRCPRGFPVAVAVADRVKERVGERPVEPGRDQP
ncbi:hypothetical protein [Streptomyces sp. MS2.AVA.5]|uniref:Uncharacterized protein n=1 Tax=Streptomyces achmelvichensis TaxID=3134111 RepID=A0ACC6PLS4_9ACTN